VKRHLAALALAAAALALLAAAIHLGARGGAVRTGARLAPHFSLPQLGDPAQRFSPEQMRGRAWVLNVWASWCAPCREEHPVLAELARAGVAPVYGVSFRDRRADAQAWLKQVGDPYALSVSDEEGVFGARYGLRGVPATFVIDREGVIRFELAGPLTREVLVSRLLPLLRELGG